MDSAESKPPSAPAISGNLVIVGIVVVAVCAAAISWWFRYNATHRAAKFWGPEAATIIRDAPLVTIYHPGNFNDPNEAAIKKKIAATELDISNAHGLTHLRNALLEDHNFDWTTVEKDPFQASERWGLMFADPKAGKATTVWLSDDFRYASALDGTERRSVSVDPVMAKGLLEMFTEFRTDAAGPATEIPPVEPER
jgi:hypothetical protein